MGMRKMKQKLLSIRLEFQNRILYETTSDKVIETIAIGRAEDCAWRIPLEDSLASGHHAAIIRKKNRLCVCDTGSRNGIFIKGELITERFLQVGDVIAIGDCQLLVEKAEVKVEGTLDRLQFLSGPDSGKILQLKMPRYVIGSAPGCDILLMNQLVSHKHALIEVRGDGCWITDTGAKNGTSVNGTKLKAGSERLLKDLDIISIAQFDLKFLDRSVAHTQSHLWRSLLIVILTAVVVFAGYYAYININPSAYDLLKQARAAASERDFDRAEALLKEARSSRGAEECRLRGDELVRDIDTWRETIRKWQEIRTQLSRSKWTEAAYGLGAVSPSQLPLWSWNDSDAAEARTQAFMAKRLLDTYLTTRTIAASDACSIEELREKAAVLESVLSESRKSNLVFLVPLTAEANKLLAELKSEIGSSDKIDAVMEKLKLSPVPYDDIISELESIGQNCKGSLRTKTEKLALPIIALKKSDGQLRKAVKSITEMDFRLNLTTTLALPSLDQCSVNPYIVNLRRQQSDIYENLQATTTRLDHLCKVLTQFGVTEKKEVPPQIACFFDQKVLAQVLRCDVLDKPIPSRGRTAPAGEYDRLLGIEPFYEFLYALPMELDPEIYHDTAFQIEIIKALETYKKLEDLTSFLAVPRNMIFCKGRLGEFNAFANKLLAQRSQLVKTLAETPIATRQGLLAHGIAIFLAGRNDLPEDAPEKYMTELKKYRAPLIRLDAEFSTAPPRRAIEIRDEILKRGLPGDPLVRKMWAKRN